MKLPKENEGAGSGKRCTKGRELLDGSRASMIRQTPAAGTLSVVQQQLVEIAKALSSQARIIIMDEPTAAPDETGERRIMRRIYGKITEGGASIIFISHRFEDVVQTCGPCNCDARRTIYRHVGCRCDIE